MANFAYGACSGWPELLERYVVPRISGRPLMALHDQTSIADAYNTILDAHADLEIDALVLLHDDLEITDPQADEKIMTALEMGADLIGVAGGSARAGLAWWNHDPVGHQRTDAMNIDFGPRTGDVDLLEGSILIFSPRAIKKLRFDTQFKGFHGYDEIAMQAHAAQLRVYVADIDTHHRTAMGFKSEASHLQWLNADELFRRKWHQV
jgi:glycosyl transferase family 2